LAGVLKRTWAAVSTFAGRCTNVLSRQFEAQPGLAIAVLGAGFALLFLFAVRQCTAEETSPAIGPMQTNFHGFAIAMSLAYLVLTDLDHGTRPTARRLEFFFGTSQQADLAVAILRTGCCANPIGKEASAREAIGISRTTIACFPGADLRFTARQHLAIDFDDAAGPFLSRRTIGVCRAGKASLWHDTNARIQLGATLLDII
jgi:hypothetical protein